MHVRQADGVGDAGRATRIVLGPYLVLLAAQAELRALRGEQGAEEEQAPAWSAQEGALGGGAPGDGAAGAGGARRGSRKRMATHGHATPVRSYDFILVSVSHDYPYRHSGISEARWTKCSK